MKAQTLKFMNTNFHLNNQTLDKNNGNNNQFVFIFFCITLVAFFFYYQLQGIVFIVALFWFISYFLLEKKKEKTWVFVFFVLLFLINAIASFISFLNSGSIFVARVFLNGTTYFCSGFAFFQYGLNSNSLENKKVPRPIVFVCVLGLFNSIINILTWFSVTGGSISRYNFSSPINHSVSAWVGLSFIAAILFLGIIKSHKLFGLFGFIICSSNLLIVITRKTQLTFLVAIVLFFLIFLVKTKSWKSKISIMVFALIVFGIVCLVFRNVISTIIGQFNKLSSANSHDTLERDLAINDAMILFKNTLGIGVGYGLFSTFSSFTNLGSAHNGLYSFASEFGVAGITLMIIFIIQLTVVVYRIIKKNNDTLIWAVAILVLSIIYSFFIANSYLFPPANEKAYFLENSIYWFLIGYLIKEYQKIKTSYENKKRRYW